MHKVQCNDCQAWLSRKDVLKRHQRNVYGILEMSPPPAVAETLSPRPPSQEFTPPLQFTPPPSATPSPPLQPRQQDFVFKYPFTANVSGPTSYGKTYFMKKLLQCCSTMISPAPERIIWLYKRWQPLYDIIQSTVYPRVEFMQGIPLDLDQDSFIHPAKKNLVILDD